MEKRRCRYCQQEAQVSIKERDVAGIVVAHRDRDQVGVRVNRWKLSSGATPSKSSVKNALEEHSAVGGEPRAHFQLGKTTKENRHIPPQVAKLDAIHSHLDAIAQLEQGRIGYKDGVSIGFPLYERSSVEAVCDTWYLDQLLARKDAAMLASGNPVLRVVFAKSEREIRQLYDAYQEEFVKLVAESTKRLWYVLEDDLPDQFSSHNKWDFAVLDYDTENAVAIISDTGQSSYRAAKGNGEGITGELSWRRSDVEFYHRLFELMYSSRRNLMELVTSWKEKSPLATQIQNGAPADNIDTTEWRSRQSRANSSLGRDPCSAENIQGDPAQSDCHGGIRFVIPQP